MSDMHSKTLKRKVVEDNEIADFIAQWSPVHCPNFSLSLISRPTKARRTNKALAHAGKADFYVPDAPPNSPNYPITSLSNAKDKGKASSKAPTKAPSNDDAFQPLPSQKSSIKKKPFLEAKYRRSDKLRIDCADTARLLQDALIEIGNRTLRRLDEEEHWHEEGENRLGHYLLVQELEKRMKEKIAGIDTRRKLQMTRSESWYEYDKVVVEGEFKRKVEEIRERALAQIRDHMIWGGYDMDEDETVRGSIPQNTSSLGARS